MEENNPVTVSGIGVKWGLMTAAASIVLFLILIILNLSAEQFAQWIGAVLTIVLMILAHRAFKAGNEGSMTFGQGFGVGMWLIAVSTIIYTVFVFIYMQFIDTGYNEMLMEKQVDRLYEQGMDPAQVDQSMQMIEKL